jgi:hypothetical protein
MRPYIKLFVSALPLVLLLVLGVLLGAYGAALYYTHTPTPSATPSHVVRATATPLVMPDNVVTLETSRDNDNRCLMLVKGANNEPDYVEGPC